MDRLDENFDRLLAVVAHPDDLQYGASWVIAIWSAAGKEVRYVIVTDREASIDGPEGGPTRRAEHVVSAALAGVDDVVFLGSPDATLDYDIDLRIRIAREIRRFRPDLLLTATPRLASRDRQLKQAHHRHIGLAVLDAVKDAANHLVRTDALGEFTPHTGVRSVLMFGSTNPTHAVDVTEHLGADNLRAHEAHLAGLGGAFDPVDFLRDSTIVPGRAIGVAHAVAFEQMLNVRV